MLVPEVYTFVRDVKKLLEKANKDHGYFKFTSTNLENREIRYTEMEFTDLNDEKFYVYVMQDPVSLNAFGEFRRIKAKKNTLFSGRVVPTKHFANSTSGKEEFVQWVYDNYTAKPGKLKTEIAGFFGTRGTKRVQLRETL